MPGGGHYWTRKGVAIGRDLTIEITTWARLFAAGTAPHGDHEWDGSSPIICTNCDHTGLVRDFTDRAAKKALAQ
jgi:hypothetical protein